MQMSQEAIEARRAYHREWRKANRDKIKEYQARHFEKQAKKMMAESQNTKGGND